MNSIRFIPETMKYICVLIANWCGWLSFIDESIINRYLLERRKLDSYIRPKDSILVYFRRRFLHPLFKYRILMGTATILLTSWLYVTTGVAELLRQDSYDIQMLAAELLTDPGTNSTQTSKEYAEMIRKYVDHMEKRHLDDILSLLYPNYPNEKNRLISLSATLKDASNDKEQAREAIWRAGEEIKEFYKNSEKRAAEKVIWFKHERLPEELVKDLEKALADSNELANKLAKEKTAENAMSACATNRKAVVLLMLARLGFDDQKRIKHLSSDLKTTYRDTMDVAMITEDPNKQEMLTHDAKSQLYRISILEGLLFKDMDKVSEALNQAIHQPYEKKRSEPG